MKRLFAVVVTAAALLLGSASAQYGYPLGYPYGYPLGFNPYPAMDASPYGYQPTVPGAGGYYSPMMGGFGYVDPTMGGFGNYDPTLGGLGFYDPSMPMGLGNAYLAEQIRQGDAQLAALMQQGNEQMAALQKQSAESQAYLNQMMAQINQYYINLYRTTTGDQTSPDATALYYGQVLHCQQNPVDCETAARNAKRSAEEAAARGRAIMGAWGE